MAKTELPVSEPQCMHDEMCLKRLEKMQKTLDGIDKRFRGNDKPGIMQRLATLEYKTKLLFAGIGTVLVAFVWRLVGK